MANKSRSASIEITPLIETLLTIVEARGFLYDPSHPLFRNRDIRKSAWEEIYTGIHLTEANDKYTYLRDQFTRKKNLTGKSGSAAKRKTRLDKGETIFMNRLAFLSGFVKSKRSTSGNYEGSPEPDLNDPEENVETSSSDADYDLRETLTQEDPPARANANKPSVSKKRKCANSNNEEFQTKLLRVIEKPDAEEDLFGATIAAVLKKFSPKKKAWAEMKIRTIMFEITAQGMQPVYENRHTPEHGIPSEPFIDIPFDKY